MKLGNGIWCSLYNCWADDVEGVIDIETLEESDECSMDCECCFFAEDEID